MNTPESHKYWSSLGKRLTVLSLALLIPAALAILYFAYSFSLGNNLQNILIYSIIGCEIAMFVVGLTLMLVGRFVR